MAKATKTKKIESVTTLTDSDLSACCNAYTTYMEVGVDEQGETIWAVCCKACYCEI